MSIKYINELEVVSNEENITGEENILMIQNNETKLVPMNLIKGSGGGEMLVVDMSGYTSNIINDTAVGNEIRDAVRNGQQICLYKDDYYMYPVYVQLTEETTGTSGTNHALFIRCYGIGTTTTIDHHLYEFHVTPE